MNRICKIITIITAPLHLLFSCAGIAISALTLMSSQDVLGNGLVPAFLREHIRSLSIIFLALSVFGLVVGINAMIKRIQRRGYRLWCVADFLSKAVLSAAASAFLIAGCRAYGNVKPAIVILVAYLVTRTLILLASVPMQILAETEQPKEEIYEEYEEKDDNEKNISEEPTAAGTPATPGADSEPEGDASENTGEH